MNKAILAGGAAALIAAVAGGLAFARAEPASTAVAQDRPDRVRADADGDQRLSQAEFVQARVDRLAVADVDRDGSVTPAEFRAAGEARRAEHAALRFDRMDANDDGSVTRAEFDAAREARGDAGGEARGEARGEHRGQRGHRAHRRGGPERMGARMDARGPVDIAEAQAKAAEAFTRLDADRDGYLTAEERRAGRQEMREHRRERRVAGQASQPSLPAPASE
ncbi:EF-hand domain-containing protein [Brevundimonas sp. Root1279]|uniref:EF-hand domain-containing protein n=1 Tax=Brevundimonas sp. Root1279 TaxID=1736443 RepID=UPI0006FF35C5|nr:EF-hand domain-containing protein [Brevundimonas sp. Root1279]KQW82480.1 hypothetical protein ASC65_09610 [Brevundimonas sp. Root1279]